LSRRWGLTQDNGSCAYTNDGKARKSTNLKPWDIGFRRNFTPKKLAWIFKLFLLKLPTIALHPDILSSPIEYLKGVGPQRGDLLKKELGIFRFADLLEYYPFRHLDKTKIFPIRDITAETDFVQVCGTLVSKEILGNKRARRLVAELQDGSGVLELVWFQGISWVEKTLETGKTYIVFGKAGFYQGIPQISHPEIELLNKDRPSSPGSLEPIYPSTEKLKSRGLNGRQIGKLTHQLFSLLSEQQLPEILPDGVRRQLNLMSRFRAFSQLHFPDNLDSYQQALKRLKFDEFFIAQVRLGMVRIQRHRYSQGVLFSQVGALFNAFYSSYLPFELTGAQKRVLKEIRKDTGSGKQMNRLLQGDVGSGKTIVALLSMLLAADNGYQSCLMAPTEILANQHVDHFLHLLKDLPLEVRLLTGSSRAKDRKAVLDLAANGKLDILIGTHAIIEDTVQFANLGLAIVDEQHRFGVAQRAKLWNKSALPPHVLVMTATPIPRTLAMTAYGDLDYSQMNELPPGRQPVVTVHRYERARPQVMDFIRAEIAKGRQVYLIFPLIEESEKMDYENLMKGYENVKAYFPEPKYWISMVHGRQTKQVREVNMQRFVKGDTQIMVATTVIEVGVNIPNATVMIVESAEKFGLSQLHQLRGRVGRGKDKSFCILLTNDQLNHDARERLKIMCSTTDGFKIAEKDMEIRGPGDIAGTRQSGELDFKLASLVTDRDLLELAGKLAHRILDADPELNMAENLMLRSYLQSRHGKTQWSRIS
jgi:ATP-dependent DNA helicase RecG